MRKRLRNMILSASGMRSFRMLRRMLVMRCKPRCQPEFAEEFPADVALVGVEGAGQVLGHRVEHGAVGGVAGGDFQRHDLTFVVDHEVQLEAVEPAHAGLAACGEALEHLRACLQRFRIERYNCRFFHVREERHAIRDGFTRQ